MYGMRIILCECIYNIYAKSYLDCASVVYSSHCLQMIDIIESEQKNITKRLKGLDNIGLYVLLIDLKWLILIHLNCKDYFVILLSYLKSC